MGVTNMMRVSNTVSAGRVVVEVAVRCVDRKSVSSTSGSSRMLHLVVKVLIASTISSSVL